MSDPIDVVIELTAKISSTFPLWGDRIKNARSTDMDNIEAGDTRYQLQWQLEAPSGDNSNATYQVMAFEILVHHHLADFNLEEAYTLVDMLTDQEKLMAASFWRDMTSVYDLESGGEGGPAVELATDVDRVGDIISYGVLAIVLVTP